MITLITLLRLFLRVGYFFLLIPACQGSGPNARTEKICFRSFLHADAEPFKHTRALASFVPHDHSLSLRLPLPLVYLSIC